MAKVEWHLRCVISGGDLEMLVDGVRMYVLHITDIPDLTPPLTPAAMKYLYTFEERFQEGFGRSPEGPAGEQLAQMMPMLAGMVDGMRHAGRDFAQVTGVAELNLDVEFPDDWQYEPPPLDPASPPGATAPVPVQREEQVFA